MKALCPVGVFDIEDSRAYVKDPRKCTTCRECVRHDKLAEKIDLSKLKDHFECNGCLVLGC